MRHLYLFIILIIFSTLNIYTECKNRKDVSVSLISKWNPFGFDQSVGEFIWHYNSSKYWEYIEALADDISKLSKDNFTDQEIYDLSNGIAFKLMSFERYQFLQSSLPYDYYSPQLSLFRQLGYDSLQKNNIDIMKFNYTSWVFAFGNVITSIDELKAKLSTRENQKSIKTHISDAIYEFDHVYSQDNIPSSDLPVYFLYSSPLSKEFKEFHDFLKRSCNENKIQYVFRPWQIVEDFHTYQPLQGYGIELALKNVEYKTIDESDKNVNIDIDTSDEFDQSSEEEESIGGFLFNTLVKKYPMYESQFMSLKAHLINTESGYENMKPWEIQGIGKKASYHILSSKNPLRTLRYVSHNLPFIASLISRTEYKNETVKSMIRNTEQYRFHESLLLINGRIYDIDMFNLFKFHDILNQEISKAEVLSSFGVPNLNIKDVLQNSIDQDGEPLYFYIPKDNIIFLNDIEKDDVYRIYPNTFMNIIYENEQYPHISVRKNLMHITMILDLNHKDSKASLMYLLHLLSKRIPFRMGVMFTLPNNLKKMSDDEILNDYNALMSMCLHSITNSNKRHILSFIQQSMAGLDQLKHTCHRLFPPALLLNQEKDWLLSVYDELDSKGMNVPDTRLVLLNGKLSNSNNFDNEFYHDLILLKQEIISLIMKREIDETTDMYEFYRKKYNNLELYHPKIFIKNPKYIPLKYSTYTQLLKSLGYLYPTRAKDSLYHLTHLIYSDLEFNRERNFALKIVNYLENEDYKDLVRLAFLNDKFFTEKLWKDPNTSILLRSIQSILKNTDHITVETLNTVKKLLQTEVLTFEIAKNIAKDIIGFEETYFSSELLNSMNLQAKLANQLKIVGKTTIITNGYIISLDPKDLDYWDQKHMHVLYNYENNIRTKGVLEYIKRINFTSNDMETNSKHSLLIPIISSIKFSERPNYDLSLINEALSNAYTYTQINSYIHIIMIINPLSPEAQKLTGIILPKINALPIDISVLLIPKREETVFPLKNFYRFMHQDIKFDQNGKRRFDPLVFDNLPQNKLLSMNIHPPEQWLVEPIKCDYDLDNILLNEAKENINAVFQLEYILMEGRCFDIDENDPPTGLQLVLNNVISNYSTDTLVMQNLGYFQLKANPGLYNLRLAKGRSDDIYEIVKPRGDFIPITSFYSDYITLEVKKKPGKERETILISEDEEKDEQSSIWDSITGLFKRGSSEQKDEVINIFSVASGHLYERFLRNMMVSVVTNTKSKVKFWIIKNFLSPTFKNTIHLLADHFGFEIEFVQYKWPSWLRHQTEKQRIIWGYKILFLDVIFPLSVKKFIYIDSDQIVRADVKELYDMDLKGAVYGFTPFCQGEIKRKETEQFRFWESGFWKDYLKGKPYHISALFVVDLQKFRYKGVGDIIRMTYEHLSADPNSLANLDQDLPNVLQHQIKIFSLPREWLWCETWCTDESKKYAKTIDLCNNPLTKTPKLQSALKVIEEWQTIDNTVRSILENKTVVDKTVNNEETNVKDEL